MTARPAKRPSETTSQSDEPSMKIPKPSGEEIVNILATAEDVVQQCNECKTKVPRLEKIYNGEKIRVYMHVANDTLYGSKKNKDCEEDGRFRLEFLQLVCTLRNAKGGIIFIHVQNRNTNYGRSLDKFDGKFEDELSRMIEDDSMYHKNYLKRDWVSFKEGEYEDYILLFIEGSGSVSTQDYNTFMPHFGQIIRPKAREMAKHIREVVKRGQMSPDEESLTLIFKEGEQLKQYESIDMEFKRMNEKDVEIANDRPAAIVDKIVDLRLYEYITSFTKLKNGGRILFGIEEEKKAKKELLLSNERYPCGKSKVKTRLDTFKSEEKQGEMVPTFHYIVKGIVLDENERVNIQNMLTEKIKKEMLWLRPDDTRMSPDEMKEEVNVSFHKTTKAENPRRYVIEVRVLRQFCGFVFTKKHGPNVYVMENKKIKAMDVLEWKEKIRST